MNRIKIAPNGNFYADEFIHPNIYQKIERHDPRKYVNKQLFKVVQSLREMVQMPITINNWWGKDWEQDKSLFINSGLRDFEMPHARGSQSRHYYGYCADLKFPVQSQRIYKDYIQDKVWLNRLMNAGLTAVEDIEATKGKDGRKGWLHVSVEWTGQKQLKIIKV